MSARNNRRCAVTTVATVAVASLSIVGSAVAYSQTTVPPTPIPVEPGASVTCSGDDVQYIADPYQPNAYYVCEAGSATPQQHFVCPPWGALQMTSTPPICVQWRAQF